MVNILFLEYLLLFKMFPFKSLLPSIGVAGGGAGGALEKLVSLAGQKWVLGRT